MTKLILATLAAALSLHAADASSDKAWPWSGNFSDKAAHPAFLLGDVSVEQRADPAAAMLHVRDTLSRADLVYGNLEGLLVKSKGPDRDIPDKSGWQHIGPEAIAAPP